MEPLKWQVDSGQCNIWLLGHSENDMKYASVFAIGFLLPAVAGAQDPSGPLPQPDLALTHANVVDVVTGALLQDVTVVIRGGFIVSVGSSSAPEGAAVLDLAGRYLLPGLMDAHTHLDNLAAARRALETGVTTVRSASVGSFRDVALRDLAHAGYIAGPDMLAAGLFVTPDLGDAVLADPALASLWGGVRTPEELRTLVRINLGHGVNVIKTRATERAGLPETDPRKQVYSEEQLRAVVEEAAARGVPVEAHAHGDEGARAAVLAGVRSIEHGTYLSETTIQLMKERGTFLVPTLSTLYDLLEPGGDYDDPVTRARAMYMIPRMVRTIEMAREAGVAIVAGADVGYGPQSITRISHEVVRFAELGFTPLEALQTATVNAARLFGLAESIGRVAPGFEADLIVVEENPLELVGTIRDPLLVISNGRIGVDRISP
jgi:imidazolonepropionase-like amidohydrolase